MFSIRCKPIIIITLTWLKLDYKCLKLVVVGLRVFTLKPWHV
jgi:hypothetical protein